MSLSNSVWIDIVQGRDGLLQEYHLPYLEVKGIKEPEMIMFIGGRGKTTAMRRFGFLPAESCEHGKIHLRSISRRFPCALCLQNLGIIFFLDSNFMPWPRNSETGR